MLYVPPFFLLNTADLCGLIYHLLSTMVMLGLLMILRKETMTTTQNRIYTDSSIKKLSKICVRSIKEGQVLFIYVKFLNFRIYILN